MHLYIAGTGSVSKALITQILQKHRFLVQNHGINIVVNGIINSRWMRLSKIGIPLHEALVEGSECTNADLPAFLSHIKQLQLPGSLFVDVTANENVAAAYLDLLQKGIHVVACSKIACSAPMIHYSRLKSAAKESGASFLYNTNVGAALPYLQIIRQLYLAGEKINRIEAVLSGTLSYVFGLYNGTTPFSEIVRNASQAGYTEPDPRLDLQGIDVMRKLLILCREMEIPLEEKEVLKTDFLPEKCLQGSIDSFYQTLENKEDYFKQLFTTAQEQGAKLKYVASWQPGKASIGLQSVFPHHPIYNLAQKDNILLIYSENFLSPLSISGAGAGAQGTAMGVLSDIISTASLIFSKA